MIHANGDHHRLSEEDLRHHIPEAHLISLETALKQPIDLATWMARYGIESTGDPELDQLLAWHDQAHRRDEEANAVENTLWDNVEEAYHEEQRFRNDRGGLLPNVAGDRVLREQARIAQVKTETWLAAIIAVRILEGSTTSAEDHTVAVSDQFEQKIMRRKEPVG